MSIRIGNKIVAGMPEKALHGIGEIFTTTDTGVIAGAVEANGGSYNLADYNSGTDSIASKLAAGTLSYVSKAEFQTQVANTGACDSFGWDGASDTTFLVPKLNPWHVGKNAPVVGNGMAIGITNGTYDRVLGLTGTGSSLVDTFSNPDLQGKPVGTIGSGSGPSWPTAQLFGISQNPSHSGMIVDLSETANLRVMVQLATGATDEALETCTSVLSDVSALKIVGQLIAYGGTTPPAGYLKCDGAAISRTRYANLFAVIGTTYGAGDGSTTFNLPDLTSANLIAADGVVYGGRGNTVLGMHYGNSEGTITNKGYIIATTYGGNPAYTRGLSAPGVEFDTNQNVKTILAGVWCIKY